MGGVIKYTPISDTKPHHFSIFRTKRTTALTYCSAFLFISFTIFLAFSPSSNSSSPWFTNIFSISSSTSTSSTTPSSVFSDQSYRSHFSSIYYYFFPNPSSVGSQNTHKDGVLNTNSTTTTDLRKGSSNIKNQTQNNIQSDDKGGVLKQNQTDTAKIGDKVGVLKANQSTIVVETANKTANSSPKSSSGVKTNATADGQKVIEENGVVNNLTLSLMKKQSNGSNVVKQGIDDLIKSLKGCNFFDGNWVRDESYPLYKPGSCSLIDEQFDCIRNGRPDGGYLKLKWKPKGCTLPRLDGSNMLELLRGKRLVFVGDSLNRNMWESLICILRNSVKDQKKVYEEFGRHKFRTEASYSFVFEDYKCTVEFFVSPFLVREWEAADKNGTKKETLRLDLLGTSADKYKNADIIVFNTGHWWTHDKTAKGKDYYQEGSHVYSDLNVLEAFRKALTTWGRWVDANVNPSKSLVFFRGYSASHFSGGQWNSGGQCDHETEPIKNETYLSHYPSKMTVLERVLRGMKTSVSYLNVTRMTDYRKDGHPSIYRSQHMSDAERRSPLSFQDCSHWCLPGVPDAWNEILYAQLLLKLRQ